MKRLIIIFSLLFPMFCTAQSQDAIRKAIEQQMKTYPASTLKDIYKNFFQDAFGPGHLMSSAPNAEENMRQYLLRECEEAKHHTNHSADYELTGWQGRFYRVNLSVINSGKVPFETYFNAFLQSARQFTLPSVSSWAIEWSEIRKQIASLYPELPRLQEDAREIDEILEQGKYASHHSRTYEEMYHPHYRLIERTIFEQQILPLL